eukprot:SAG31_NODE_185_length_20953_cov_17.235398_10_plen_2809_part_00
MKFSSRVQNHDAACAAACATTQCSSIGAAAAILDTDTGCSGCYPQNPATDIGCFPGADGYPTEAQTFHAIAGLRQGKYYAFEVAAFNHFGTGPYSSYSYAVHTHSLPSPPSSITKFDEALDGTAAGIVWTDGDRLNEGTDSCTSATAMMNRQAGCSGFASWTASQQLAKCDGDYDATVSTAEALACGCFDIVLTTAGTTGSASVGDTITQFVTEDTDSNAVMDSTLVTLNAANADIAPGMVVTDSAGQISSTVTVAAVDSTSLTLSTAVTLTASSTLYFSSVATAVLTADAAGSSTTLYAHVTSGTFTTTTGSTILVGSATLASGSVQPSAIAVQAKAEPCATSGVAAGSYTTTTADDQVSYEITATMAQTSTVAFTTTVAKSAAYTAFSIDALSGAAPAGSTVSQATSGATGVLAVAAVSGATTLYVTKDSSSADFDASNALTVTLTSGTDTVTPTALYFPAYKITGLSASTSYSVSIKTINAAGTSAASAPLSWESKTVPAAPLAPVATAVTDASITLTWTHATAAAATAQTAAGGQEGLVGQVVSSSTGSAEYTDGFKLYAQSWSGDAWVPAVRSTLQSDGNDLIATAEYNAGHNGATSSTEPDVNYWYNSESTTLDDDGDGNADWLRITYFTNKYSSQSSAAGTPITGSTITCDGAYTFCPVDTVEIPYLAAGTQYRFKLLWYNAVGDSSITTVSSATCAGARITLTVGAIDADAAVGTLVSQATTLATGVLTSAASGGDTTLQIAVSSGTFSGATNDITISGQTAKTPSAIVYNQAVSSTTCPEITTLDKEIGSTVRIYSGPPCVYNPNPAVTSVRPNGATDTEGRTTFAVSSAGSNVKYRWQLKATDSTGTSILYDGLSDDADAEAGGSKIGECVPNEKDNCAVMTYQFPYAGDDLVSTGHGSGVDALAAYDEVVIQVIASNSRGIVTSEVAFSFGGDIRMTLDPSATATYPVGAVVAQGSARGVLARGVALTNDVDSELYITVSDGTFANSGSVTINGNAAGAATGTLFDLSASAIDTNTIEYCGCTDQADPNYWSLASFSVPEECAEASTFGDEGISTVTAGKWEYFQLFFTEKTYGADVALRVDTGSVDMYVSAKSMPDPGRSDSFFASGYATGESFTTAQVDTIVVASTTVTITAENDAIVVGQLITGAGISGTVTVDAISGTTLTLSSAQSISAGAVLTFKFIKEPATDVSNFYVARLPYKELAQSGTSYSIFVAVKGVSPFSRFQVVGTIDEFKTHTPDSESLLYPSPYYIKLTVPALTTEVPAGTSVSQATSSAAGTLTRKALAGATTLYITVSGSNTWTATNDVTVDGQTRTPTALYDLRFERVRLSDVTIDADGISSTLLSGEHDFMEFYYPHAANDLDVELSVTTTQGTVELYTSRVDRFPSPLRATTTNTYGYWGPPRSRGYTGTATTCDQCHTGAVSSSDVKITVAAIDSAGAAAGTAVTQGSATGYLAVAAAGQATTIYVTVTSQGVPFTTTGNVVIGAFSGVAATAVVAQDSQSFMYTVKPTDQTGSDGILYIGVQGAYPAIWKPGDDLARNEYTITAKVYRYRVESDLLEPGRPVTAAAGDDSTGGSLTTEDRYSVVTQDNFNYYEVRLSQATYQLRVDVTVHYGTLAVFTSNTALPTQDQTLQLTSSGVIGYTTGDITSTTDASGSIDAQFDLSYDKLNMVDNYVYIGIIARGGEGSYDLTVTETTFGRAAPTDLYLCEYETSGVSGLPTDSGSAVNGFKTNVGLTDACDSVPEVSSTTVSFAAPGASYGDMYFYQVYIGPRDTEMQSVSRRSGPGSRTTDISTDPASWGNDWTEIATPTWTQKKEFDLDVDITIQDGLAASGSTEFTMYASTSVMYPSARTGTSSSIVSQTFTNGANDESLVIPVYTQEDRMLYIGIEVASPVTAVAGQLEITRAEISSTRTTPTTIGSTTGTGGSCADNPCGDYGTCVYDPEDSTRKNALTGVVSHYCICDEGFYGDDCSVAGFGRIASGPAIALPAEFQGYKSTMNEWSAGTSTCSTQFTYTTRSAMTDDGSYNAAIPGYGLQCQSGGRWTTGTSTCERGTWSSGSWVGFTWEPYVKTNDDSVYSGCTSVGAGTVTDATTCQTSCDATASCNAFNVDDGALCTLLQCPVGDVAIATTASTGAYTYRKLPFVCCKSVPAVNADSSTSDQACPAADIIPGVSSEEECTLILGATDQVSCELVTEDPAEATTCTAVSISTSETSNGDCSTACDNYVATGGMGCTDYFFYDSTSPDVDYCVLYYCPPSINADGTKRDTTSVSTSQLAVQAAQTCSTVSATTEAACEQSAYLETPSSACPPAAVAAGITDCDAFEAVALDCESQDCKPTADVNLAYKVGYISCTNGGATCTINAAKPIISIPFSVSGLPSYAKVAAYVDGQPYPSKSSNTIHLVNGCVSSDAACIAAGTAAFADSSVKIYDLEPLGPGVKHTAVLMLMTDSGEPLGSAQTSFEVGYGGGCKIAPDGSVCGGRGTCHLGYCVCYDGYYGSTCDRTVDESGATCAAATTSGACSSASDVTQGFTCTWDTASLLCKATFAASGPFTVNEVYEKRQQYLTQSKLGETRFLNTRMLEANSAMLTKSDASMVSTTSTLKSNLDTFMGTLTADVASKMATVQSNVNTLYAKSARNVVKLQQAREESLRLQTQNLEEKLDMQRSLASHQRSVQNRLDSKRFEAYKLNAIKMDKLKQEFARSRFTINQLKTANGPLVDATQFTESSCTADQFYRVDCTETTSDRSSLYTGTGYRTSGTVDEDATNGDTTNPSITIEGSEVAGAYTDPAYGQPVNRGL